MFPTTALYYFTKAHIPRALKTDELKQKADALSLKGKIYPDVNTALKEAKDKADKNDLIIVCGSVFLVAEVDR